jgi:hypothetical protein
MWFPYWIPYHVVRIAEMRPALIVVAAAITIAILVWRSGLPESLLARLS